MAIASGHRGAPTIALRDPSGRDEFARNGFAVVSALDAEEIEGLRQAFEHLGCAPDDAYLAAFPSHHSADPGHRRSVDRLVRARTDEAVRSRLEAHRGVAGSFTVRWPGEMSGLGLHRGPVLVDESASASGQLWVALDPMTEDNGRFWFVPGSHRWWRDRTEPPDLSRVADRLATEHAVAVTLDRGDVLVCDSAVLRLLTPNRSDRPAILAEVATVPEAGASRRPGGCPEDPDDVAELLGRPSFAVAAASPGPVRPEHPPLSSDDLDGLVASGQTEVDEGGLHAAVNTALAWCYRCGSVNVAAADPHPLVGRVELLCASCTAEEAERPAGAGSSTTPSDVPTPERAEPREHDTWVRGSTISASEAPGVLPQAPDPVLVDPDLDESLRRDGYVVVPDALLPMDAVAEAREQFGVLQGAEGQGFHNAFNDRNRVYRRRSGEAIAQALDPLVNRLFNDYEPFIRPFLCKFPGEGSYFEPHRDWMYVDERAGLSSYVLFVALEDIDDVNGQVLMLPGSHRLDDMLRGTDLWAPWVTQEDTIRQRYVNLPMKAGQSAVWNHAIVHGSLPNLSDEPRIAAACWVHPTGSQLLHYRRVDAGTAAEYEIGRELFDTANPYAFMAAPPRSPARRMVRVGGRQFDAEELGATLDAVGRTGAVPDR